ncbi:hypothetical protein MC885_019067 [Smutsia gigantea]|nr:hypothetical protein MC885_019067 [Smutsia gigantea]
MDPGAGCHFSICSGVPGYASLSYHLKTHDALAAEFPPTCGPCRVVNGDDAVPYSWPWQYEKGGTFHHTCGGSLIAPDWVMTAGHCISSSMTYQVVLGEYDRAESEGPEQVIPINAEDLFVHPLWNPKCVACGAQLGDTVQLACLPPAGDILPNQAPCYISGWGRLYTDGPLPDKLQQALLPVVDYDHCSKPDWWGASVKKTMVCAGGDTRSGCNVHGVTSFVSAFGCNTLKKPTVFTRVSAFNEWIEKGKELGGKASLVSISSPLIGNAI